MSLKGKVILLTGGTGSFGQKFTEIVLAEHDPKAIRIFSRGEFLQMEMARRFDTDPRLRFFIGDVRDKERLQLAMRGADIVVHAAALKQVPACEYNPIEAVKTNINGAANVIDAAIGAAVPKVAFISTDKAVHPVNLYGSTKLVAEKLFVQANSYTQGKLHFSCVRYGNVVGSRGSVIPLFLEQQNNGAVTITDKAMTRFLITLDQGVRFVMGSIEKMVGGEVFVPKIPSMRLLDIVEAVAPHAKLRVIGIRPGEKLHEVLITPEESRRTIEFDNYYVIEPEHPFWNAESHQGGKRVGPDFYYGSDVNTHWLTPEELRKSLSEMQIEV